MKYLLKVLFNVSIFIILLISSTKSKKPDLKKYIKRITLTYYTADLKRVYVCNNYLFYNETKALLYHELITNNYRKVNSNFKPLGGTKNKIKKMKNKYIIAEKNEGFFYEINPFSERYKGHVWGDCDECFSNITNSEFRSRVLKELNFYRKLHGVPPVSYHSKYNNYAKEEAKKFLKTHKNSSCVTKTKFGCVYLELSNYYAHLAISALYEKLLAYYDWKNNLYKSNLETAIQLIWKKVKYIGIGFAQEDDHVHIFLTFSSKVKNDKDYKKNVRPVMKKYIKKYGTLLKPISY
ncbi:CAP domain-containing protein [Strongyloides ratti]|uniref:CAP domain-containing protein n=1 Tax=Strongyloides ratti TaxID=34506 RepID=A0A090MWA2_STRRB|nr:CAP domain-containing protein [Strongyloides ratti]CEF63569.2 CAP domain-containing protein [Strongyloides ratti]